MSHLISVFIESQETEPIRMRQTTNQNQQKFKSSRYGLSHRTAPQATKKNSLEPNIIKKMT